MRTHMRFVGLAALVAASVSCGSVVRNGTTPAYLVLDSIAGIRGATTPGAPASVLSSDVVTNVPAPAPELNALANDAANVADEANALNTQAQNLANESNATADNTVNPKDADEQNVSGM